MTIYNMTLSTTETINNVGTINIRQGDKDSQTFVAKIIENNIAKADLKGYSVFLNVSFSGYILARDLAHFDYATSTVTYTLKESFYQKIESVTAYFSFEKDGVVDSTANFVYTVIPGSCNKVRQGNYIYELEEILNISEDIIKNKDFTILLEENRRLSGKLDDLHSELTNHENETDNPHNVTPEQLGVLTNKEVEALLVKNVVTSKVVFDGASYMQPDTYIKYGLKENEIFHSVKLIFSSYDASTGKPIDSGWQSHVLDANDFRPDVRHFTLVDITNAVGIKAVYLKDDGITGHSHNWNDGQSRKWVLRKVVVYYTNK